MRPKLQLALDYLEIWEVLRALENGVAGQADIIEVGTMPIYHNGQTAVRHVRAAHPNSRITADVKMPDAGGILTPIFLDAGADTVTVISAASLQTMGKALESAGARQKKVQIELYGLWNRELAREWLNLGIREVVYHRCFDLSGSRWAEEDFRQIGELCEMGFLVTAAGAVTLENLAQFSPYPLAALVVGRAITEVDSPLCAAQQFQAGIRDLWSGR